MDFDIKMGNIDVSIIVPVYNAEPLIGRCIQSILSQEGNFSYEVIFVDDGSTDDSVGIVNSYQNPNFKVFRQENAGPAKARNKGIVEAQGKYVTFIDADDYWMPTFLQETIDVLEQNLDVVAVNCAQKHLTITGNLYLPTCKDEYKSPFMIDDYFSFWAQYKHVCTGSVLMRTDIVKATGGQREDMRATEDLEFWCYLSLFGKWVFIPDVLFVSDGTKVTQKIGYVEKLKPRWYNTPSLKVWETRIIEKEPNIRIKEGYKSAIGWVARNLIYCHILSEREQLGRKEAFEAGAYLRKDKMGVLMYWCKYTYLSWAMMAWLIRYREYHR